MIIRNNISAINTSRNQKIGNRSLNKALEKLSSGYRINRAGDDAAGLAISELMRSQINGLKQAERNVTDGVGLAQTADGALTEIHSMLDRLKTLAIQAANGTYSSSARQAVEEERLQLLEEFDRIASSTDFNEIDLFDSSLPANIDPPQVSDNITLQIGPSDKELLDVNRYYLGSKALLLDTTDFSSVEEAGKSVDVIDNAIEAVSDMRGSLGAAQNHLEHTHNSLTVTDENMSSAESRIRDTNMAEEVTAYTKDRIVLEASQAMMSQAVSIPQMILNLLK